MANYHSAVRKEAAHRRMTIASFRRASEKQQTYSMDLHKVPATCRLNVLELALSIKPDVLTERFAGKKHCPTVLFDVVGPQRSKIANIKPSVSNHWIRECSLRKRPGLFLLRLRGWSETSLLAIRLRRSLDQRDVSINTMKIYMAIGVSERSPTETLVLPFHLTGNEVRRYQVLADLCAVDMVTDQHGPTDTVRKFTLKVNLLGGDSIAGWFQADHPTPNT